MQICRDKVLRRNPDSHVMLLGKTAKSDDHLTVLGEAGMMSGQPPRVHQVEHLVEQGFVD